MALRKFLWSSEWKLWSMSIPGVGRWCFLKKSKAKLIHLDNENEGNTYDKHMSESVSTIAALPGLVVTATVG